jgi:hypothetical protein
VSGPAFTPRFGCGFCLVGAPVRLSAVVAVAAGWCPRRDTQNGQLKTPAHRRCPFDLTMLMGRSEWFLLLVRGAHTARACRSRERGRPVGSRCRDPDSCRGFHDPRTG